MSRRASAKSVCGDFTSSTISCCNGAARQLISRRWEEREPNCRPKLPVNYAEILEALRELVARERIEFLPLAPDAKPISLYAPIQKYVLDLKNRAKHETAAEDLFTALCKDVLGFQPTRQVGIVEGWVDFMLLKRKGDPLPLELKPLFQRDGPDAFWRSDANPKQHVAQVKKYLRDHEYPATATGRIASTGACQSG